MKKTYIWIVFLGFLVFGNLFADNRIIAYLKHAPDPVSQQVEQEARKSDLAQKIEGLGQASPADVSQSMVKHSLRSFLKPTLSGIVAIYGGYMDISDPDGLISFPLRHVSQKIYVAITAQINMVNIKGATYSHREYYFNDTAATQIFSFVLAKDTKGQSYWDVKEEQLPADKKINPITMVLLTHPKNIVIPQGHFFATENVQLVLPEIYVVGRSSTEEALLSSLDIRRYFEPVTADQKKASDTSLQKMINNL